MRVKKIYIPAKQHAVLSIAEVVKMLRELKGWTQEILAEKGRTKQFHPDRQTLFISEGLHQGERLFKLNKIAIQQMKPLTDDRRVKKLGATSA
jgi:predicted transcriptional regulator